MRLVPRHRRPRLDPTHLRLPLIALIDVVLFLLFYFMVAGNLAAEESELTSMLRVKKTQASSAGSSMQSQTLRIELADNRPVFRIGNRSVRTQAELLVILRALPKEPGIAVSVDGRVAVDTTAAGLQAVQDAGFTRVTYLARD